MRSGHEIQDNFCVSTYAYDSLSIEHRFLSNVVKLLPITFSRWINLRRWLRASGQYDEGQYAYLFDNADDGFRLHRKMGFDMTYFIEKEPAYIRTAVAMYLLHRLELIMNTHAELLSIYMDEAWKFLSDPYWQGVMADFFAKIRSKNAHFIFATQTPETILESKIHPVIMANTATMVLFTNNSAVEETYKNGLHLTQQEFEAIKDTEESRRLFLVKQRNESLMCRLNLSGLTEELMILSPSEDEVKLGDKIRAEVGDDPALWIPRVFAERKNAAKESQEKNRSVL
ncbi:MAG: hypothetical protein HKM04_00495 [Legionellales bacterium]|nr:hypothetical protein [Legionellales bacterium]